MKGVVLLAAGMLAGCTLGPKYSRPVVPAPAQFRGADQPASAASLADTKWFDLFHDDVLTQLVNTALEQNHDLRIAAARVLQARQQYRITGAEELPRLDANGAFIVNRPSLIGPSPFVPPISLDASYTSANFSLNWELDLWGLLRRQTEAARAQYLATDEARRGVITTLIADVSTSYFQLRELDLELEIAQRTRDNAQDGLRITNARRDRGAASGLDVHQAEQLLYTATSEIASIEREIGQTENAISVLLGNNPSDVPRGKSLSDLSAPPEVPAGLPSDLLARRPDILQAEELLVSANANIGVAKALYFPKISLTAVLGEQSRSLTSLFTCPARAWTFDVPTGTVPVFSAGAVRAAVHLTEAQKLEAVEGYSKAIQGAFREVSDALIAYRKNGEQTAQEQLLVNALRESERLSRLRYVGGLDSYLQVLDSQRNLFQGELDLARLRREEILSVVQLYRALGGGWQ